MKVLLIIFIFYVHNVISDEATFPAKNFPKKVPGQILINYGKYANKPKPTKLATKAEGKNTKYTFFQSINEPKNTQNIPESPYFLADPVVIEKTRVKKVLPDYVWSSLVRSKRAADAPSPKNENITTNLAIVSNTLDEATVPIAQNNETRRVNAAKPAVKAKSVDTITVKKAQPKPAVARSVKKVLLNIKKNSQTNPIKRKGTKIARKNPTKKSQVKVARKLTKSNKLRTMAKTKTRSKGKSVVRKGRAGKKVKPGSRQKKPKSKKSQNKRQKSKYPMKANKSKTQTNVRKGAKKQSNVRKGAKKQTNVRKGAKKQGKRKGKMANNKMQGGKKLK